MRTYLLQFFVACCLTLLLTPVVKLLAERVGAYGSREAGRDPSAIPRLGGLAIFLASVTAWAWLLVLPNDPGTRFRAEWQTLLLMLTPSLLVLLLGVWDDLKGTTAKEKLAIEIVAAALAWWGGFRIMAMPILGYPIDNPLTSLLLTCFWIVAVTNSLNLIDGLDGLAAGIAFFATLCMFIVSIIVENYFAAAISITLTGALVGFLRFNLAPAQIYLGDTGSLFLGFLIAVLAVEAGQKSSTLVTIVVPYMALGLPLLDTSLAMVRRFLAGQPIFTADQDHIHHQLLRKIQTPHVALLALYTLAALSSLGSLLIIKSTGNIIALVAVLVSVAAWFLFRGLDYAELQELNVYVSHAWRSQRRVMANQIAIRKASKQVATAGSLEDAWLRLVAILDLLGFDEVSCRLEWFAKDSAPSELAWRREGFGHSNEHWSVVVPVRIEGNRVGELRLLRLLSTDSLQFHFSSVLNTLVPSFEKQISIRRSESLQSAAVQEVIPYLPLGN